MKVKIFLEPGAELPTKAHGTDYGYDVKVAKFFENQTPEPILKYGTGIHIDFLSEIKHGENVCMLIYPRSSIYRTGLVMCNSVGVVDAGYHGEIMAHFYKCANWTPYIFEPYREGDRFIQIAMSNGEPIEWVQVQSIDELGQSERGFGGHGSTGF